MPPLQRQLRTPLLPPNPSSDADAATAVTTEVAETHEEVGAVRVAMSAEDCLGRKATLGWAAEVPHSATDA